LLGILLTLIVGRCRQSRLVYTNVINATLSYKRIPRTEVAYTTYLASSLNTFADKTLVPSFSALFTYLSKDSKAVL